MSCRRNGTDPGYIHLPRVWIRASGRSFFFRFHSAFVLIGMLLCLPACELPNPFSSPEPLRFALPGYSIAVSRGHPFGILSLKLDGQQTDFCHPELPLADWEWFRFERIGKTDRRRIKLINRDWREPEVREYDDRVVVAFFRAGALADGVDLGVEYELSVERPEFVVRYTVANHSGILLREPYVMVGLPGFTHPRRMSAVGNGLFSRLPLVPFDDFIRELRASGRQEDEILRHEPAAADSVAQELKGIVSLVEEEYMYTVEASFLADGNVKRAYAAHTRKKRYTTSHLYAFLRDIENGHKAHLTVGYTLFRTRD